MKLSEAMRLGAMLNQQGFISDSDGSSEGHRAAINGERTCALVAAQRAVGHDGLSWSRGWTWINDYTRQACPQCGLVQLNAMIAILHLNDFHRWTREQIADWVETIERAQETVLATEVPVLSEASVAVRSAAPK
jgi:hypothetical protein